MNDSPLSPPANPFILGVLLLSASLSGCVTMKNDAPTSLESKAISHKNSDTNNDGKVSKSELARGLHREALAEFDLNNDSYISNEEWASTKLSAGSEDEHFNRLDKDSDGKIEEAEALKFISEHVSFSDIFKKLDQNGDSHLDLAEYAQAEPASLNITLFSFSD